MVKLVTFGLVLALCLVATLALPIPDTEEVLQEEGLLRQKRVTCDVLSVEIGGVALNDSACAVHCLTLGKKGGSCGGGVCYCRKQ